MAPRKDDIRKVAYSLFVVAGLTPGEIEQRLGISDKTLKRWRNQGKWDELRDVNKSQKPLIIKRMYGVLSKLMDDAETTNIKGDAIIKISRAIKELEGNLTLDIYMQVFAEFGRWVSKADPIAAQKLTELQDEYIRLKVPV